MDTLRDREPNPQELDRAIRIVAAGLFVLATRDHVAISSEQVSERARNIVAGLLGDFNLVPHRSEAIDGLRAAAAEFGVAAQALRTVLQGAER